MDLGNRIKTEREKLNMSQDDLAQRMISHARQFQNGKPETAILILKKY